MPSKKLNRYYQTLIHVKPTQLYHQVYYRIKNCFSKEIYKVRPFRVVKLELKTGILGPNSYLGNKDFVFLNLEKSFPVIDWNEKEYGKLWAYNLNYFDFLNQAQISREKGLELMWDFILKKEILKVGLEPYPISLRGINWIKFISKHSIQVEAIDKILYHHYHILKKNQEYHLLGNHLLENGFSLLFGAYYFKDEQLLKEASKIFKSELKEQILKDGGHFELSPMYHQIILHRLLDCINLSKNNDWQAFKGGDYLIQIASLMLGWLDTITYADGSIPMVNDSAFGIAATSNAIFNYAKELNLSWTPSELSDSGYIKWKWKKFELLMDFGSVGPDYIPGHAHADTFNFELFLTGVPFIIDTGISTYEKNRIRQAERSTHAHNTVVIDDANSSNVWGGFRVAQRAKVFEISTTNNRISAKHNGYVKKGITHKRTFERTEQFILIHDELLGRSTIESAAYLHFHPSIKRINTYKNKLEFPDQNISIDFSGGVKFLQKIEYNYCIGFNKTKKAIAYKIGLNKSLITKINL